MHCQSLYLDGALESQMLGIKRNFQKAQIVRVDTKPKTQKHLFR